MILRVLPFIEPDRKRRDEDAGFEQHIKGDIGHAQLRGQQAAMFSAQRNGHIRITVRAVRATSTAAMEDGPRHVVATGDRGEEAADGGIIVEAIHANATMLHRGLPTVPGTTLRHIDAWAARQNR